MRILRTLNMRVHSIVAIWALCFFSLASRNNEKSFHMRELHYSKEMYCNIERYARADCSTHHRVHTGEVTCRRASAGRAELSHLLLHVRRSRPGAATEQPAASA